jgi:hypothetical protein
MAGTARHGSPLHNRRPIPAGAGKRLNNLSLPASKPPCLCGPRQPQDRRPTSSGGPLWWFAVIPLPGSDDWRLFASIPEDFPEQASTDDVIAAFAPKLQRFTGYDATALQGVGLTSVFRINRRLADTYDPTAT